MMRVLCCVPAAGKLLAVSSLGTASWRPSLSVAAICTTTASSHCSCSLCRRVVVLVVVVSFPPFNSTCIICLTESSAPCR